MRIRSRLLLLVLAVLLPTILGAAIGMGYVYNEEQKFHRQSMRETTHALALVLDKEFAKREAILHTLASSPALDRADFKSFHEQARALAAGDSVIVLADREGRQFLNTRVPFGTADLPKMVSTRELRRALGPDATVVSNLYVGPFSNTPRFTIEIPVRRGGRIVYYIAMGSYASQLQSVFAEQQLPASWHAGIVDRNGLIVARSKKPEKFVGKPVREAFAKSFRGSSGFHEGLTLGGVPATAFFSRAPHSEWIFYVAVPTRDIRRTAIDAIALMGAISLVLLGLATGMALAFARGTAKPIEALRLAAARIGRGQPAAPARCGIVEIDAVSDAMAQADQDIRSGREELEQRVAAAVASAERSQRALLQSQKLEALGRLTGGIAHDFNNVLQTVATGLELALLGSTDARVRSSLESSKRAVQRATELTRQLAAFGRVQDARLETIDPGRRLQEIQPLLQGALRSDIVLELDIAAPLWPLTVDALQFELALLNLVINARDAMPKGGSLCIEARNETLQAPLDDLAAGDYVRLSVNDCGEGMSPEVLAQALEPFFTTKGIGKGSGMGLPQAYGFAKQSGGTLQLRSQPGTGTQVILYLPRAARAPQADKAAQEAWPWRASGEVVLLVEDDTLVRDVVQAALVEAGFLVLSAGCGEEALHFLESGRRIDLVFSDIVMPGTVSGIDLAEIVQQRYPQVRVVLATGYTERRVALAGVRILAKPYDVGQAVEALQAALATARQ